ncbi:hypothetical protein ACFQBQ_16885 [Granulicella cerasi]|uniref:Uncharacterized protein n=1 Tax=Granulicella cerasi TaxID=741063 RepID=A0ABW1ZCK3_9BACT|nr:hypothetical protein [Granulicella cerasi]
MIFGLDEDGRHGNFHHESYAQIRASTDWKRRLEKSHTAYKRSRARADWPWRELDCANSSDALLMNIFCHPGTIVEPQVQAMLGLESPVTPVFGFKPRTPLRGGKSDNTEIDMKLDHLLVEAKLTESDFQSAKTSLVHRYRDIEIVFDVADLPVIAGRYSGYQLIRSTLAAYAAHASFCVLCDARRADLIEKWYRVMRAVHLPNFRHRLQLLTWQELAAALPASLQVFLAEKYGIAA